MLVMKLKSMHLFISTVTNKVFRTVSNAPIFNCILHSGGNGFRRNYTKAKLVEDNKGNNPTAKTIQEDTDLTDKLIKWAVQNNISYLSFSKLLKVLTECGINYLPTNSRALLKAKEEEIKVVTVPPGVYAHFGLEKNLTTLISALASGNFLRETDIEVSIFIDNLPLSRFSNRGFWVILGSVVGFAKNIFFVGAYHGYTKPKDSNLFLAKFVTEAKHLCAKGLEINGVTYNVKIKRLICDAPAKAFVLNVKDFNGYSSCTKCNTVGQFEGNKVTFPEKGTPKTDEDFEKSEMYQSTKSSLLDIPRFGVVSNVPLDYMHLVCLGVVKKLLSIWVMDKKHWISEDFASDTMKTLASVYPTEFQKPKSFKIFGRWGGHDFRHFLLYHGPVVLRGALKNEYLDHFLLLHVACRLLCIEATPDSVDRGRTLLSSFIEDYKKLYKGEQITHNFHGLYHLADECSSHGTLDDFSAFPFEKFLIKVRNSMERSKKKTVPHTLLKEAYEGVFTKSLAKLTRDRYKVGKKLAPSGEPGQFSRYEKVSLKNFDIIPGTKGDKYVLLKNSKIVEVVSVLGKKEKSHKTHLIAGREFSPVSNFHSQPFGRLPLNTYTVGEVSEETELWPVDMIDKKCMIIPTGKKEAVMISLLDENF